MNINTTVADKTFIAGLGISGDATQRHIGIVYTDLNGVFKICHLQWHRIVTNELLPQANFLVTSFLLDDYNKNFIASALPTITSINNMAIPYGLRAPIQPFDRNFRYIGTVYGEGLTCATFVIAILRAFAFNILDESTWVNAPEDTKWQQYICDQMKLRYYFREKSHIDEMQKMVGSATRFRPEQVFACGVIEPTRWPVEYQDAAVMADSILGQLGI